MSPRVHAVEFREVKVEPAKKKRKKKDPLIKLARQSNS